MYKLEIKSSFLSYVKMGRVLVLLLLLSCAIWGWLMVFNQSARDKYRAPWTIFTKEKPKPSYFEDGLVLFGAWAVAGLFSIIFLAFLIGSFVEWLQ